MYSLGKMQFRDRNERKEVALGEALKELCLTRKNRKERYARY